MRNADRIRLHGRVKYALAARGRKENRFSIRMGDVVRDLKLNARVPAVCSALKSREFLRENGLRIVDTSGPPSGQSTTVTYTYEFTDEAKDRKALGRQDAWNRLRGIAKDVFASYGGGEEYLRQERANFYNSGEDPLDRKP